MNRSRRDEEREFYLRLCVREQWSKRELERQLAGALFERVVLSPTKLSPPLKKLHRQQRLGAEPACSGHRSQKLPVRRE